MPSPAIAQEPRIVQAILRYRNSLLNAERQSALRLVNAYGGIFARLQDKIRALEMDIAELGDNPTREQVRQLARYKSLLRQTADEMDKYSVILENELTLLRNKAIDDGITQSKQITQLALPAMPPSAKNAILKSFNLLPRQAVVSLLGALSPKSPLDRLLNEYGAHAAESMGKTILENVAQGFNPRKIADAIRKEMGGNLTRALTVARTETLRAYRTATLANYTANNHIVKGWEWLAAKSTRTCVACIALDGKRFDLSQPFMKNHPNCRCTPKPITITYKDLGLKTPMAQFARITARAWFEDLDEADKRAMLGNAAYEAYRNRQVTLDDFVGVSHSADWGDAYIVRALKDILH